jgi:hypothetical protein
MTSSLNRFPTFAWGFLLVLMKHFAEGNVALSKKPHKHR